MASARVWITRLNGIDFEYDQTAQRVAEALRAELPRWLIQANTTAELRMAGLELSDEADTTLQDIGPENQGHQPDIRIEIKLPTPYESVVAAVGRVLRIQLEEWQATRGAQQLLELMGQGGEPAEVRLDVRT